MPKALVFGVLAVSTLVSIPISYLVLRVFQGGAARAAEILSRPRTWDLAINSIGLAGLVGVTVLSGGVLTAWLIVRTDLTHPRLWLVLSTLPLAVPSYVIAYAWLAVDPSFAGFGPAWLVLSLSTMPFVVLASAAVLRTLDAGQIDVAKVLGQDTAGVFRRVEWPHLRGAAVAGMLLAVLYTLSDFGAVAMLRYDTLTRAVYASYRASFDRYNAAVLALILVAIGLLVVALEARTRGLTVRTRLGRGVRREPEKVSLRHWRWPAIGFLVVPVGLALVLPGVVIGVRVFIASTSGVDYWRLSQAALTSVGLGVAGAALALVFSLPIGIAVARYRSRAGRIGEAVALLTQGVPGVVVGLALVVVGLTFAWPLYQTVWLLIFGYAIVFMARSVGVVRTSLERVPPVLEETAATLGSTTREVLRRVTLPLAGPGIATGFLLVLLAIMKELPVTLFLRPTGMRTLATELWSNTEVVSYSAAAPYALALVALAAVPTYILTRPNRVSETVVA